MLWLWFQLNGKTTDRLIKEAHSLAKVPDNRELDVLLSSGEQVSISKLSILLNELGYKAISLTGWQAGIYTNNTNQNAIIENIDISRISKELSEKKIVVIAGFQGFNDKLDITTLGRGGSDTTAVAIAAAINAKHCYIFSDVDGVYSTDPNKLPDAKKLETLSYVEMLDIANEGARVLHNRCIEIGEKFKIPIITKSTFNNKSGSIINEKIEEKTVKSIVQNDDIILVNLKYSSYSVKLFYQVYDFLINQNILPIQFVNNSLSSFDVDFLIKSNDINKFQKALETELKMFDSSFKTISRISIIGYGITSDSDIVKKVLDIIKKFNINIFSIDITNAKIIFTFSEKIESNLLELLHHELFES